MLSTAADEAIYRRARLISATQPKEDEEAAVMGSPQCDCSLCWNRISTLFLLHGRSNLWVSMREVKIHLFMAKY